MVMRLASFIVTESADATTRIAVLESQSNWSRDHSPFDIQPSERIRRGALAPVSGSDNPRDPLTTPATLARPSRDLPLPSV